MYVKLFQKILDSSIWLEKDSTLRVWITVLCSMDVEGFCAFASVDNLARRANVKPCHAFAAIAILEAPDQKSANDDHQGRRIERVQGGWIVLNSKKYRDITRGGELRSSRPESSQLVSTGSNSFQSVLPTEVTTNGINKSVTEVEVEADIEVKIKNIPVAKATVTHRDLAEVYFSYPRKVGKGAAIKAIDKAIKRLLAGEANNPISNRDEAVVYLCQRAALFGKTPAGNNGDFTPHPATWFNRSSYLDDESEWSKSGSGENGNGKTKLDQWIESAERELADT